MILYMHKNMLYKGGIIVHKKRIFIDTIYYPKDEKKENFLSRMLIFIKEIFIRLLHPYSPVTVMFITFFLSLLPLENYNNSTFDYLIKHKEIIILFLLIWLIFAIFCEIFKRNNDEKNKEIAEKNEKIRELEIQSNNEALLLSNRISVFAKDAIKLKFYQIAKEMVNFHQYIECAQVYSYTSYISNTSENIVVKVAYVEGYVREDYQINSILQAYYSINIEMYEKIMRIIDLSEELDNTNDKKTHIEIKQKRDKILMNVLKDILIKLIENDITEEDTCSFEILRVLFTLYISNNSSIEVQLNKIMEQIPSFDNSLLKKRTGIFGSILLKGNIYSFINNTGSKKGRQYISFPFIYEDKRYVVLFTMSNVFRKKYDNEGTERIKIKENFLSKLDKTLHT